VDHRTTDLDNGTLETTRFSTVSTADRRSAGWAVERGFHIPNLFGDLLADSTFLSTRRALGHRPLRMRTVSSVTCS
jgi:hypothetical protein